MPPVPVSERRVRVRKVTGPIGKVWVLEPVRAEGVEHGTGVAGVGCIKDRWFPR